MAISTFFHVKVYMYMHPIIYLLTEILLTGVEKNNANAKRNYFSSSRWELPLHTEARLELLHEKERKKWQYTKQDMEYWTQGGIEQSRSKRKSPSDDV